MEVKKSRDTIQSLAIGISILDVLADAKKPLKINEIQEKTQITKSNLYKYINTLMRSSLIYRDEYTGTYQLGSRIIQYGMAAIGGQDIITNITPYLQLISDHTENTTIFSIPTYNGPVITKINHSNQILNIGAELGTLLPPKSSAGKIYYVFSHERRAKEYINKFESTTKLDINEKMMIKEEKIAFAREPLISEVSSVSIPVLNYVSELIGIITVVGFTSNIPATIDDPLCKYLQEMYAKISLNF